MAHQRLVHPDGELAAARAAAQAGVPFTVSTMSSYPKGIVHPEDARRAVEVGADAVVVANHGGRQLDGTVPSVMALPEVADSVGGDCEVLVDSGIRTGTGCADLSAIRRLRVGFKPYANRNPVEVHQWR